jgi:sugar lactone lactonase YvrE
MILRSNLICLSARTLLVVATSACVLVSASLASADERRAGGVRNTLAGVVEGAGLRQHGYTVSLYASDLPPGGGSPARRGIRLLGRATSDHAGRFTIEYEPRKRGRHAVLYVLAEKSLSMLASAIGDGSRHDSVVVNERTTVATGVAFAQFIADRKILGNRFGMLNAVDMAANMADPTSGRLGEVLDTVPNADENSTRATFNSMANLVAGCVEAQTTCDALFALTTPGGGPPPKTVLQAVANMTKHPSRHFDALLELSREPEIFAPALDTDSPQNSWLLFIKFTGGHYSEYADTNLMSGPGNLAFDRRGFAWINDNYVPTADLQLSCAGQRLMKFHPSGQSFPGSPYFGGGLSGAGFGITLDPRGRVWVGNFGFESPSCDGSVPPDPDHKIPADHGSVSVFRADGRPISGSDGFTQGHIWWPQATVSDPKGNIWLANCGNDTVTFIPKGNARQARNFALPGGQGAAGNYTPTIPDTQPDSDAPLLKPFGIAIDPSGRAWVTANEDGFIAPSTEDPVGQPGGGLYRVSPDGTVEALPRHDAHLERVLSWPMGISGDSKGNMWVSNSNSVKVPCVDGLDPQDGQLVPSVALYRADDSPPTLHTGGGLTIPWGNAIDGNDTLWVFNFGQQPTNIVDKNTEWPDTSLSHFCGADESRCPKGKKTGDPISPEQGYVSDALDRITGGQIDPSGNVWLMNNWKKTGPYQPVYQTNPGGNSFVIVPGAAAPVQTPLIGPPRSFAVH